MTYLPTPPDLIPPSAPFTPEQRAWLSGFFAGFAAPEDGAVTPLSPEANAAVMAGGLADADDDEAPWHDQTLALDARMEMAKGRPLRRRLMAAMAQQDCGQCGYNCADYADALAARKEARLNLCAPGGKDTARMLKTLAVELDQAPPTPQKNSPRSLPQRSPLGGKLLLKSTSAAGKNWNMKSCATIAAIQSRSAIWKIWIPWGSTQAKA